MSDDTQRVAVRLTRLVARRRQPTFRKHFRDNLGGREKHLLPDALDYALAHGWLAVHTYAVENRLRPVMAHQFVLGGNAHEVVGVAASGGTR